MGKDSLGRYAGERRRSVRLLDVLGSGRVVDPHDRSRFRVQGVNEGAHEGPDAGGVVDLAIGQYRSASGRPGRDQPAVAQHTLVTRCGTVAEDLPAGGQFEAVQKAVVGHQVDPVA